jgi:hypothetical protein
MDIVTAAHIAAVETVVVALVAVDIANMGLVVPALFIPLTT